MTKHLVMPLTLEQIRYLKPYWDKVRADGHDGTMVIAQLVAGHAYVAFMDKDESDAMKAVAKSFQAPDGVEGCPKCGNVGTRDVSLDICKGVEP